MLQVKLEVHEVEDFGRLTQIGEEFGARNPGLALLTVFSQHFVQVVIGKLGDDDEFAGNAFDAVHRQQEGMANGLYMLNGAEFFLGANAVIAQPVEIAIDELDGLEDAAGGFAFPDLPKTS